MKTAARSFACIVALATLSGPLILAADQPFSLTLAMPKEPAKAGEPVILLATITNTSTQTEHIPLSDGSDNVGIIYQVHVLDERGQPAPNRPFPPKGQMWVGSIHGSGLEAGQSKEDRLNLSHIYDLSRPGKYKIWIAEPYGAQDAPKVLVVSNTVTLTVVK